LDPSTSLVPDLFVRDLAWSDQWSRPYQHPAGTLVDFGRPADEIDPVIRSTLLISIMALGLNHLVQLADFLFGVHLVGDVVLNA
jgi:hypothetical protein